MAMRFCPSSPVSYTHLDVYKRQGYDITQFSFTPRGDVGSGFITKATLKVKNTANGEYKTVATDQVFRACLLYTSRCV